LEIGGFFGGNKYLDIRIGIGIGISAIRNLEFLASVCSLISLL
jgi:hypothetical protein